MIGRILLSACLCALLVGASHLRTTLHGGSLGLAHRMLGEQAYAVLLKDAPVGQLVLRSTRLADGTLEFTSALRFQLSAGQPVQRR